MVVESGLGGDFGHFGHCVKFPTTRALILNACQSVVTCKVSSMGDSSYWVSTKKLGTRLDEQSMTRYGVNYIPACIVWTPVQRALGAR